MNKSLIAELSDGKFFRLKLSRFCEAADISLTEGYRLVKSKKIKAKEENGRIYILASDALDYVNGAHDYEYDHLNANSISKMEHARRFKSMGIKVNRKQA